MEKLLLRRVGQSLRCSVRATKQPNPLFTRAKTTSTTPVPDVSKLNVTWPEYLAIRKTRRRWEAAFMVPCAIAGFVGGVSYFGTQETDPTKPIMGVDPMFFYGGCTVLCAGAGILMGPMIGGAAWRVTHRKRVVQIDARDREFYRHIVKNRVDPSSGQSARNLVPDYYGENIGSLPQYRQWLRDQTKFKRKATLPENEE